MKKILTKYIPLIYGSYFNSLALVSKEIAAKKAFELFCSPRKGKVLPHQKGFLDPAKSNVITTDGVQLQTYKWDGTKETVLLLHGWESNVFRWRNLIEVLKEENYNVIAFDAPGHGYSSGSLFNVPLYNSCAEKVIATYHPKYIVGHSVGGMTSLYNQYKNPTNSIEKIISLGAPSELSEIMSNYQNLLKFNLTVLSGIEAYFIKKFKFTIDDFSTSKMAKDISTKGLLIHDKFDKIAPYSSSKRVHENWKNSTLISTEGLGHSLHQENINHQIIAFLKSE
jgi:pimeloyl-ACP methyl ester carboxylesterase